MARNYTMAEAARILRAGVDKATLIDLGKKFPLTMMELAKQNENGLLFAMKLPEKLTTRKFEMLLRDGVEPEDDADENEVIEEKANTEVAPEPKSWKEMSQYQRTKARKYGEEYVAACKKLDEAEEEEEPAKPAKKEKKVTKKVKPAKKVVEEDDEDDEEEEEIKPAKKEKVAKKAAKKVEVEDDDDFDDFDFDDDDDE